MRDFLDWGPIRVKNEDWIDSEFKGRIGYLDDMDDEDGIEYGIVYFGEPFVTNYELIPMGWLESVSDCLQLTKWKQQHPRLAEQLGVP